MNNDQHEVNDDDAKQNSKGESSDESHDRRDALRRIGKYSAYAVPALLALTSKPAAAYP